MVETANMLLICAVPPPPIFNLALSTAQPLYYRGMLGVRKRRKVEGSFTLPDMQISKPNVRTEAPKEVDALL